MRQSLAAQLIAFFVLVVAVAFVMTRVSTNWANWVVFGVLVLAVLGAAIAVNHRQYPHRSQRRRFTRDSDSRW